tara:strand:- start:5469 stop:6218 length:750 start_codon:yes stop_codon:yes gene_type:complete
MQPIKPFFEDEFGGSYLLLEPGSFILGDQVGSGHPNEQPCIEVTLTEPIFLGARPVTQVQWSSRMGSNPSKFQEGWSAGLRPIECITFEEVQQFLDILNSEPSSYLGLNGKWRLPTEAEWEYAAKAGTATRWSFGNKDSELDAHGWHAGNSGATTREVGSKKANQWGFYDMHGMVYEMTSDCWNKNHSGHLANQAPRKNLDTEFRVAKGGSWFAESDSSRSSSRRKFNIHEARDGIGIRLVWDPKEMVE